MHPETRDEHARRAAAAHARNGQCADEPCAARATVIARVTMPDTLARIDVPLCAHHAAALADTHAGRAVTTGDPVVALVHHHPA